MTVIIRISILLMFAVTGAHLQAKTDGASLFCVNYPESPHCSGSQPSCSFCHTSAIPERNAFGVSLSDEMRQGDPTPLTDGAFSSALPNALDNVKLLDSDGDGTSNISEIEVGSFPGDKNSTPQTATCSPDASKSEYQLCEYDRVNVLKKVSLDFCGVPAPYADMEQIRSASLAVQDQMISDLMDECLDSEYWLGKDGVVWQLGHQKIRPVGAVKSGEDAGSLPLVDYFIDYNMFVYTQIDGHDARDVLRAQYSVERTINPTVYTINQAGTGINVTQNRRAGLISTTWNLGFYVMFSPLQRTAAWLGRG